MSSILEDRLMKATGFVDDSESYKKNKLLELKIAKASGASADDILSKGVDKSLLAEESKSWWRSALDGVEDWAVGDETDWKLYLQRGLGKTNINLMMQNREKQGKDLLAGGIDWRKAYAPEPEDTGAIERLFESVVALGGDLPTFVAGGLAGGAVGGGNPIAAGFGAGFVNDSIKGMYLSALERGDVDTFGEYWNEFLQHGIDEGIKGGLTMAAMVAAPNVTAKFLPMNKLTVFGSRWGALTGVGSLVEGELPTKETMVNNALLLGLFAPFEGKASKMVEVSSSKNKVHVVETVKESKNDPLMIQEMGSKNIKTFSKDKKIVELEIATLKEELSKLNKLELEATPKVITNKASEVKRIESEIKIAEKEVAEAALESNRTIAETKLEILTQELKDIAEGTAKVIEKKDLAKYKAELKTTQKKELVELEARQAEVLFELNSLKQKQKANEFVDEARLKQLKETSKENISNINKLTTLVNKDKRMQEIERQLTNYGEPVIKTYDKNKEIKQHPNESVNSIINKIEIGQIKLENKSTESISASFATNWLDRLYPIKKAVENAREKGIELSNDAYVANRIQMGNMGKAMHFIQNGTIDFKTGRINGKSLYEILKPLIKTTENYVEFTSYAVAKRAMEKYKQKIETPFTLTKKDRTDATKVIKEFEGKYGNAFKELNDYQQRVLTYLKDAGILSPELYKTILDLNRDYVPLNRVLEGKLTKSDTGLGSAVRNPLKKMKGSVEKTVIDPLETMFLNTLHFVQIAERNRGYKAFIDLATASQKSQNIPKGEKYIDAFAEVKEVKKLTGFKITEKEAQSLFDTKRQLSEDAKGGITILRKQDGWLKETEIPIYENGKLKVYEVGLSYATALKNAVPNQKTGALRYFGIPTRIVRAGATLNLEFLSKSFVRDSFFSAILSKNMFLPIIDSFRGVAHIISKDAKKADSLYNKFIRSGAMQSTILSFDRSYFRDGQMFKELTGERKQHNQLDPTKYSDIVKPMLEMPARGFEKLRELGEIVETAPRIENFRKTIIRLEKENAKKPPEQRLSEKEILEQAGFEARDLSVDFRKMGNKMQSWNMIVAFFNARVQGLLKIKETMFHKDPKVRNAALVKAGIFITLPSLVNWWMNKDSETYKNLPEWQKDLNWIIITNEGEPNEVVWKIPKPFELGWVFGTLPEKIADGIYNSLEEKDLSAFGEAGMDMLNFGWDQIVSFLPIPDIARPAIESYWNESFFNNRPIVPYRLERVLPEYQYDEYTTGTSKLIARTFAKLRNAAGIESLPRFAPLDSPKQVDNLINAWFAGLGNYATSILDYSFVKAGLVEPVVKPWSDNWVKNLADIPAIRAFVARNPSAGAEPLQDFWDIYRPIAKKRATYDLLVKEKKTAEALELYSNIGSPVKVKLIIQTADTLKQIGDLTDKLNKAPSTSMSANEKRDRIDESYYQMIQIAKIRLERIKEID